VVNYVYGGKTVLRVVDIEETDDRSGPRLRYIIPTPFFIKTQSIIGESTSIFCPSDTIAKLFGVSRSASHTSGGQTPKKWLAMLGFTWWLKKCRGVHTGSVLSG